MVSPFIDRYGNLEGKKMKTKAQTLLLTLLIIFSAGCSTITEKVKPATNNSELVNNLTQKLGVSNEQATVGAGAILSQAKAKLSPEDFSKVSKSMPESDSLIKASSKQKSMMSKLGMEDKLSENTSMSSNDKSTGGLGALAGSFGALGLSPDMIGKFMPVILGYAKEKGGDSVMGLLQGVIK